MMSRRREEEEEEEVPARFFLMDLPTSFHDTVATSSNDA